jgi:hypothetical protein
MKMPFLRCPPAEIRKVFEVGQTKRDSKTVCTTWRARGSGNLAKLRDLHLHQRRSLAVSDWDLRRSLGTITILPALACGREQLVAQHDPSRCCDLCWNNSLMRGDHGMAPPHVDPMALLAQRPERPALHCRRRGTAFERRDWSSGRLANRGGARPHGIGQFSGRTTIRQKVTRAASS